MTGDQTPLNNNIRELFNLMNFLDPARWSDLEGLEKEYADLNQESVKELHNLLRPYFLRRIKSEVLQLPAKVRPRVNDSRTSQSSSWVLHTERGYRPCFDGTPSEGSLPVHL